MLRVAGCGLNVGFFKTRNLHLEIRPPKRVTRNTQLVTRNAFLL